MKKYLEKKTRKYVVATLDIPTLYLYKTPGVKNYIFSLDIEKATKTRSKKVAQEIIDYYRSDTSVDTDLVIVPVEITYELIDETN